MRNNKGFTLVELIVVLVILAILAAILVPALLGYIDRANQEKSLGKVHDLQVAAKATLGEYYAIHKDNEDHTFNARTYMTPSGKSIKAYNVTNYTFARIQASNDSKNSGSNAFAKSMLQFLTSDHKEADKEYTFQKYDESPYGKTASEIASKKAEGLVVLFSENYRLLLLQYSDLDGYLYTYEKDVRKIDVQKNGKFIATGK